MATFDYRRSLSTRETVVAAGVGAGFGVIGFYLTRIMLQKTPLESETSVIPTQDMADRGQTPRPKPETVLSVGVAGRRSRG